MKNIEVTTNGAFRPLTRSPKWYVWNKCVDVDAGDDITLNTVFLGEAKIFPLFFFAQFIDLVSLQFSVILVRSRPSSSSSFQLLFFDPLARTPRRAFRSFPKNFTTSFLATRLVTVRPMPSWSVRTNYRNRTSMRPSGPLHDAERGPTTSPSPA